MSARLGWARRGNGAPGSGGDLGTQEGPLAGPRAHSSDPLTWVLAAPTPLDETDDEQDQHQEGDGAHQPDEPALGGEVGLGPVVGVSWGGPERTREGFCMGGGVRREACGKNSSYFVSMFLLEPSATT